MRDRRLGHVAAGGEVARAHAVAVGELAQDGESGGVRGPLEEEGVGVDEALHAVILTSVDVARQDADIETRRYANPRRPGLHATPELVTLLQQERERHIDRDHLARVAACHRACCSTPTSLADRVVRRLRPEVTPC
jgi:hypothetical protein